ncbi:MAG: phage tail tape measure protein [Oscillospiraceae bacterium]|nr:phage tail tape measure protein [Oscillospiraceae bacterium]
MADGVKIKINGDTSDYESSLKEIGKLTEKAFEGIKSVGETAMKAIGTAATAAMGAVTAASGAVINYGSEFERSAAKASTLFGDVSVDADNLNKKLLGISSSTGVAATGLNEALYSALSAGIPATEDMTDATDFLAASAKLATAGFTDIDTALSATAKTINAYGLNVKDTERIQGILIQTQNKGITTVGELGEVLSQVTPTAAAANVSFEEVGAALATMTAQGTPTAQATTQLNAAISAFLSPNEAMAAGLGKTIDSMIESGEIVGNTADQYKSLKETLQEQTKALSEVDTSTAEGKKKYTELEKAIKETQTNISDLIPEFGSTILQTKGLSGALSELSGNLDGSVNGMSNALGSSEALKAALAITGENAGKYSENLEAMSNTAGLVDDAYGKMANTLSLQSARMTEGLKNLGIAIYNENDSIIASVAGFGADLLAQLQQGFDESGIDGIVSAFGDILVQVVSKVAEYAPMLIDTGFSLISSFVGGIVNNLPEISAAASEIMNSLFNGIVTLIPNIMPIIAELSGKFAEGFIMYQAVLFTAAINIITAIVKGIADNLDNIIPAAQDMLQMLISAIINNLPVLVKAANEIIFALADFIINNIDDIIDAAIFIITTLSDGLVSALPKLIPAAVKIILNITAALIDHLDEILECALELIIAFAKGLIDSLPELVDQLPKIIDSIVDFLISAIPTMIEAGIELLTALVDALPEIIEGIVAAIPKIISGIITAIMEALPLIIEAGIKLFVALIDALPEIIYQIVTALPKIINGIISTLLNPETQLRMGKAGFDILIALLKNLPDIMIEINKSIWGLVLGIVDKILGGKGKIAEAGKNLIEGFWKGIKDAKDWLMDQISGFFNSVTDWVRNIFGEHSPSTVFADIGENLDKGLAKGIKGSTRVIIDEAHKQVDDVLDVYNGLNAEAKFKAKFGAELPDKFFALGSSFRENVNEAYNGVRGMLSSIGAIRSVGATHNYTTNAPVIQFYEPVESPDTVARAVNRVFIYGLAGAR